MVQADADVLPVLKHLAVGVLEPGWLAGWTLLALWADRGAAHRRPRGPEPARRRRVRGVAVGGPVGAVGRRTTRPFRWGARRSPAAPGWRSRSRRPTGTRRCSPTRTGSTCTGQLRPHLGFGAGPHHCPAHPLVTAVAGTALDVLLERMPDVRPAPGWRPAPHGWRLRLPGRLDAVWDAGRHR